MASNRPQGRDQPGSNGARARIRLLDVDPDLVRFLTADDRAQIEQLWVPTVDVSRRSFAADRLLSRAGVFGAVVLDGILLSYVQIGDEPGAQLLGPGEFAFASDAPRSSVVAATMCHATDSTRLALLGNEFLAGVRLSPRLMIGLQAGMAAQLDRLATQLVICQLPRVEDRLLAMLWHLSESWGHVTSAGTTLPLSLTHELLGALVGARRPTVTLALGELAGRGAIVQQDLGWLLLERLPEPEATFSRVDEPARLGQLHSSWAAEKVSDWDPAEALVQLSEHVHELREQHARSAEDVRDLLTRVRRSRERNSAIREHIRVERGLSPRLPPSSGSHR